MKISVLQHREPFVEIFEHVACDYLRRVHGQEFSVASRRMGGDWLLQPHLNAIFSRRAANVVRQAVKGRYGASRSLAQEATRRMFVQVAAHRLVGPLLSTRSFDICPRVPGEESILFRGGLQRVRLFDFRTRQVSVLAKPGQALGATRREVEIRRTLPEEFPCPQLVEASDTSPDFTETLVAGIPLDQISDDGLRARAREKASFHLGRAVAQSLRSRDRLEYVEARQRELAMQLVRRPDRPAATEARAYDMIARLTALTEPLGRTMPVAISHGDPQDDNVLWTGSDVVLTDWEFSDERHVAFDYLHDVIAAHRTGFGSRLRRWETDRGSPDGKAWLAFERVVGRCDDPRWRTAAGALFLIDKLVCQARSACSPDLYCLGPELEACLHECLTFVEVRR